MFPIVPNKFLKITMNYGDIYEGSSEDEKDYLLKVGLLGKKHFGIDWAPIVGHKEDLYTIVAPVNGIVIRAGFAPGFGNHVRIQSTSSDKGYIHLFGHMAKLYAKEGQKVVKGTPIGVMGSTGSSSAKHLHYECRATDGNRIDPSIYCT